MLDIVIPTAHRINDMEINRTLDSIHANTGNPYRIFLIVNRKASKANFPVPGAWHKSVKTIVLDEEAGFVRPSNIGLCMSSSPFVALVNDDVIVPKGWDMALIKAIATNEGCVLSGPVTDTLGRANSIQNFPEETRGKTLEIGGMFPFFCAMFSRECISRFGLLSMHPDFAVLGNDDEYCQRVRRGGGKILLDTSVCVKAGVRSTLGLIYTKEELTMISRRALSRLSSTSNSSN